MTAGFIFIQFFARSLEVLIVGQLLGGLVLGTYTVIAPTYASEVCPVALRGILTSYVNLCFVIGQFLANGISAGTHNLDSHWAYSLPFALQWVWPAIILCTVPFAPESPWWLVRKERMEDAEKSLRRLASSKVDVRPDLVSSHLGKSMSLFLNRFLFFLTPDYDCRNGPIRATYGSWYYTSGLF